MAGTVIPFRRNDRPVVQLSPLADVIVLPVRRLERVIDNLITDQRRAEQRLRVAIIQAQQVMKERKP